MRYCLRRCPQADRIGSMSAMAMRHRRDHATAYREKMRTRISWITNSETLPDMHDMTSEIPDQGKAAPDNSDAHRERKP